MQRVFVIDSEQQPLMPCHPARARKLLEAGKAAVFRRYPFTIILKERTGGDVQSIAYKIDPGSRTTGLALVADFQSGKRVIWAGELRHRGMIIKDNLLSRRQVRRSRRHRKTRYRPARFENRTKPQGWLPPSLASRVNNVLTWGNRLYRFTPLTSISMELVRFDTQAIENPEITGIEYQQGTLLGYEVREYLLEKWGRKCAYCGAKDTALEIEHIVPKSRGGSNRVSNLTLACTPCNQNKGAQTAAEFGYPDIQKQARRPLKDAAAVNATRWRLWRDLNNTGFPVEVGSGGRTKYNRRQQHYRKDHWIDAACVGVSGEQVFIHPALRPLVIKAMGRGSRHMCQNDGNGFPKAAPKGAKRVYGFQTGDVVRAVLPAKSKYAGVHVGRVVIRSRGGFTVNGHVPANWKYCTILHRSDGYEYSAE